MPLLRRFAAFPAVIVPLALALFCGKDSNNPAAAQEKGMLEIRARIVNKALAKGSAAAETAADSLVVVISADDMETMTIRRRLDLSRPSAVDTVKGVPPGNKRKVTVSAIGKNGKTTHIDSVESHTVAVQKSAAAPVYLTLIPAAGSIYLQLTGLPAKTKVHAGFTALDNSFTVENTVKREARTFLSLDNIPHDTKGVLRVAIIDTVNNETTHISTDTLTFNARANNAINLEFKENTGMLGVEAVIYVPGVTVGSYDYARKSESLPDESGELIITEIMWNASNDNYIELYNPSPEEIYFDTLTTDVDGTVSHFTGVVIAPKGYFVIGRQNLPYFDVYTATTGGLPITTTGNWITVKSGKGGAVIDRVICAGGKSGMGWPSLSTSNKRSIVLASDKYNVTDNNFGKNWSAASEPIEEEPAYYGTPGR